MKHLLFLVCLFCSLHLAGQVDSTDISPTKDVPITIGKEWASPGVLGDRRSKGIRISYNLITPFQIRSIPVKEGLGSGSGKVTRLEQMDFALRIPISWRGRTKIVGSIEYLYEEYHFENPDQLEYDFYANLEDKHLNSLGLIAYVVHSLDDRRFVGSRIGLELNGDYQDNELPFMQQAKASIALLYGWKADLFTSYGFGAYYSYTIGRPSIYPVFLWNKTFNSRWGVEAVLPANFRLRHKFNEKTILLLGGRVAGYSYHILSEKPPLSSYPQLELRNSNLYAFLEFEQEIYDFLWLGLTAGYRYNVNFYISEEDSFSNSRIIESELGHSPYFNVSLFVVPPRKLLAP